MKQFFKSLFGSKETAPAQVKDDKADLHLAVAALMVEAARADEDYTEKESSLIASSLGSMFDLSHSEATRLREEAELAQENAIDLHRFTKVAKTLSIDEKRELLESLWRIVLSDSARDPHEDALMRRLCGLLHIADMESGKARQRVAAQA